MLVITALKKREVDLVSDFSNPKQYEIVVARMLRTKLAHDQGSDPVIKHREMYQGASGQRYEIDLSFESMIAGTKMLILVECNCYKRFVGVDDVVEFAYKVRDIGARKGIIATTTGFQRGATFVAKREGIALVRAVKTWVVAFHKVSIDAPRYLVRPDGLRLKALSDIQSNDEMIYLPPQHLRSGPIDNDTEPDQVKFFPEITGFIGDPFNLLEAAEVFLKESGLPYRELIDVQDRFAEYRMESMIFTEEAG